MQRIYHILLVLLCLLGSTGMAEAQAIGEWKVYPAYQIATENVAVGKVVYSLMNGNLLRYDSEDGSVKVYDCLNDLNDVHITHIAYCEEAKRLVLTYDNQNIDLLDLNDNVLNIASLKDKTISNKKINSINIQGTTAYLATGFGYVEMDVKEGVILDTYQLGLDVASAVDCKDMVWICGDFGIYNSPTSNTDMHNLSSWKRVNSTSGWKQLLPFNNEVFLRYRTGIHHLGGTTSGLLLSGTFDYMKRLSDGTLCIGNSSAIHFVDESNKVQTVPFNNGWQDISLSSSKLFWASEGEKGLRPYKFADNTFVPGSEVIQPNSPRHDLFYRMQYVTNSKGDYRLLVAGGMNSGNNTYTTPFTAYLDNGEWTNFDESPASELLPGVTQVNTTDLVQDPKDDTHHFAGTWRNGLKEYKNGKLVKIYHSDNSPIRSILPDNKYYHQYETATATQYDSEGNLWLANQHTDTIVRFITPTGKWHALNYNELKGVEFVSTYLFSSSGINFLECQFWPIMGFFAFDTNGTLTNVRDDKHKLITTVVNQDGTSYNPGSCYCMTEDLDGRIWCGTQMGLFVIDDATQVFDDDFRFTQVKIARNDGSGLADYLLNGVCIQCIAVDGGNRKWIGTESNGIYLVSADGMEMIHHFQADNSPLLSDNVQTIAIHPKTGEVMIGTDKGLCSYISDATEAEEELSKNNVTAYPNPVAPDHTGPIRIEGLTFNAEVKICTVGGQLVWSGVSNGGTCTWNGCNKQGRRVASGVYNVISNTEDGNKAVVCRIVVIR